jgi:hypothetical protein
MASSMHSIGAALVDLSNAPTIPGSRMHRALASGDVWSDIWASRPQLEAYNLGAGSATTPVTI